MSRVLRSYFIAPSNEMHALTITPTVYIWDSNVKGPSVIFRTMVTITATPSAVTITTTPSAEQLLFGCLILIPDSPIRDRVRVRVTLMLTLTLTLKVRVPLPLPLPLPLTLTLTLKLTLTVTVRVASTVTVTVTVTVTNSLGA